MRLDREYRDRCAARGMDGAATDRAVAAVERLASEVAGSGDLAEAGLDAVERHVAGLVARGEYADEVLIALARWFVVARVEPVAIRLLSYLLPVGVLPAMAGRLASLEGEAVRDRVMVSVTVPPPGSPPEAYPPPTAAFTRALLAEIGPERAKRVLRWNVHGMPASAHHTEREFFLAAPSLEAWLEAWHGRQVAILERHAADGTLWFEQRITPRVVDFVRGDQEVLGGVREGDRILVTKIPYDPDRWLESRDPLERRRLACHCPLAVAGIEAGGSAVPPDWCACSAGYEKFIFDVVFGVETEAEVLQSVLSGAETCRYAVRIPEGLLASRGWR